MDLAFKITFIIEQRNNAFSVMTLFSDAKVATTMIIAMDLHQAVVKSTVPTVVKANSIIRHQKRVKIVVIILKAANHVPRTIIIRVTLLAIIVVTKNI